jgi:hypothetical protein
MRVHLVAALALIALPSPAWGADWDRWFHVSWGPEPEGKTPVIEAMPEAVTYRISVTAFDIVSADSTD